MTGSPKTIGEILRGKVRSAARDLDALQALRDNHVARGLDEGRLDAMYERLADYRAMLDGVVAMLAARPDPRDAPDWRLSDEGRALERDRNR